MADFYGVLESTSFRVKDRDAFLADPDVERLKEEAEREVGFFDEDKDGYFAFGWYGMYPGPVLTDYFEDDDADGNLVAHEKETDLREVIQRHILPGDVCRIGVSGNEKLRYIGGGIWWVTAKGVIYFDGMTEWSERLTEGGLTDELVKFADTADEVLGGKVSA